jgi:hypothetical protein
MLQEVASYIFQFIYKRELKPHLVQIDACAIQHMSRDVDSFTNSQILKNVKWDA